MGKDITNGADFLLGKLQVREDDISAEAWVKELNALAQEKLGKVFEWYQYTGRAPNVITGHKARDLIGFNFIVSETAILRGTGVSMSTSYLWVSSSLNKPILGSDEFSWEWLLLSVETKPRWMLTSTRFDKPKRKQPVVGQDSLEYTAVESKFNFLDDEELKGLFDRRLFSPEVTLRDLRKVCGDLLEPERVKIESLAGACNNIDSILERLK